jgi:hypothetical protein
MAGGRRIADVAARRIVAMLVLEHAVEHKELLTAVVHVHGEVAGGCIADDRCRARDLIADAVEHAPVNARHRRRHPVEPARVNHGTAAEIGVEVHGWLLRSVPG